MPEKPAFVAGLTTDTLQTTGSIPANHFMPARSEIFLGQKILVRNFVGRIFLGSKFENSKNFPVEI